MAAVVDGRQNALGAQSQPLLQRPAAATIDYVENSEECETWWDFFKMIDKDHDGMVPVAEMRRAVANNRHFFHVNEHDVHRFVNSADCNNDDMIDFPEFCEMMCRAKQQNLRELTITVSNLAVPKNRQAKNTNYLVEYTCWPPPLFVILMSLLEITMYFFYAVGSMDGISMDRRAPIHSPLALQPQSKFELWRYFSYILLHNGYVHLLSNIVMQLILGIPLELVHKGLRILTIYFLGAFTGALMFFVFDPNTYLVGASGGVYALITAHLADVFLNWSEMPFRWVRIVFFIIWITADFGYAIQSRYVQKISTKVAIFGHVGGAIAGLFLGVVVLRNLELKNWERVAWWVCLAAYALFVIICAALVFSNTSINLD